MAAPATVKAYLASLPADRRAELEAVRKAIRANLDGDYEEGMQYGAIGYYVPHSVFPAGYHCDPKQPLPFAGLASRKGYLTFHCMGLYLNPKEEAWLRAEWAKTGRKLDMGKACIRFKKGDDLPLDVIGKVIRRMPAKKFVGAYEAILRKTKAGKTKKKA